MNKSIEIFVERTDANSDEYILTEFLVNNGVLVNKGDIIAEVETTKAIIEVESKAKGYFYGVIDDIGKKLDYFTPVSLVFPNRNDYLTYEKKSVKVKTKPKKLQEQKITKKAQKLINKHSINIDEQNIIGLIRGKDIYNILNNQKTTKSNTEKYDKFKDLMISTKNPLVLVGPGSAADSIWEILENKYTLIGVVGKIPPKITLRSENIFTTDDEFLTIFKQEKSNKKNLTIFFNVGINMGKLKNIVKRYSVLDLLNCNVVHPNSTISKSAIIGIGNYIGPNVTIGAGSIIGDHNWLAAHANVDHHNIIGSFNLIGPGTMFSGNCSIGERNIIGAGSSFLNRVNLGDSNIIEIGSQVKS
jgi:acetyltransferase-like isoleucine patch superfamily enzyme